MADHTPQSEPAEILGFLLRDQGRRDEPMAIIEPVFDRLTDGFGTADLRTAKAFIDDRR